VKRVIFVITIIAMMSLPFANVVHSEEGMASKEMSTVHLNLKEAAELSPETDHTREAVEEKPPSSYTNNLFGLTRSREWTTIGTWNSDTVKYDTNLSGTVMFNMWWVEDPTDDDYNARMQMRWTVETDTGEELTSFEDSDEYTCEQDRGDPCEWTGQVNLGGGENSTTALSEGTTISITVEYQSFQNIYVYYDNATFDSGMAWDAEGIFVGGVSNSKTEISIDLVQAWKTDLGMALDGGYIVLTAGGEVINNTEATVSAGEQYEINGTAVSSERITWVVESNEGASISFSYAANESAATPVTLTIASLPGGNPDMSSDESGGIPGFSTIVAVVTISLVALRNRF